MAARLYGFNWGLVRQSLLTGLADVRLWLLVPLLSVLTYGLAFSGIDAWINDLARTQNETFSLIWSAFPMLAGLVVPVLVPIGLALYGKQNLADATLSAFLISLAVVSLLKGLSSRVHSEAIEPATSLARSQLFRIGLFEAGFASIVEGWPSGHTATNGAVMLTIAHRTQSSIARHAAYVWFTWVALATIFGISGDVHWPSDTIAGFGIAVLISMRLNRAQN